jgi:hypothetical protein
MRAKWITLNKSKLILVSFGLLLFLSSPAFSQASRLNFGLTQQQDPATLPVSVVKPELPVR